jgi:hypothetical protein
MLESAYSCIENRVSQRRSQRRNARFADAAGRFHAWGQMHFDPRSLRHMDDFVFREILLFDAPVILPNSAAERP